MSTHKKPAGGAGKLRDNKTLAKVKEIAASDLAQARNKKSPPKKK